MCDSALLNCIIFRGTGYSNHLMSTSSNYSSGVRGKQSAAAEGGKGRQPVTVYKTRGTDDDSTRKQVSGNMLI